MASRTLTRGEKQAETRTALLRSAAKLFRSRGLEGTSVEQIAQGAGYTKGAFYSNFSSKEQLYLVMLDERFAEQLDALDRRLSGTDDPDQQARYAAAEFVRSFRGDEDWKRLYFEFVAHAMRDDRFREELATRHRALRARLTEILRDWAAAFVENPPIPFEDVAAMTDIMSDGFLLDRMVDPDLDEDLYATLVSVFFRGLQAMAAGWEPDPADFSPAASSA
jgi:AcrR family transcriptional regulator